MSTRIDREGAEHLRFSGAPRTTNTQSPAPGVAAEVDPLIRVVEKATCYAVHRGNEVIGSFAGPDCGEHAQLFASALQASAAAEESEVVAWEVTYAAAGDDLSTSKIVVKYPACPDDYEKIRPLKYADTAPPLPAQVQEAETGDAMLAAQNVVRLWEKHGGSSEVEDAIMELRAQLSLASRTPAPGMAGGAGAGPIPIPHEEDVDGHLLYEVRCDAARWRMLPAFLEKHQIDYVGLKQDIDAAIAGNYCEPDLCETQSECDSLGCRALRAIEARNAAPHPAPAPQDSLVGDAERDVLAERRRQIESEGWTPEHDSEHATDEMAQAAACYAHPNPRRYSDPRIIAPIDWPWDAEDWKPGRTNPATTSLSTAKRLPDRRRDLVKAGALILAEIERYDRAAIRAGKKG